MSDTMNIKKTVLIIALAIAGLALASLARKEVWDGGFQQVEYRVTFLDKDSRPLKGVQLRVFDSQGKTTFGYPITDFTDESPPSSDENGMMIFHHVGLSPEFGGSCQQLFFVFPVGKCDAPKYTVQFLLSNRPVASFDYTDLEAPGREVEWKNLPIAKRKWEQKIPSSPSLPEHLRVENRKLPPQLDFYVISKVITVSNY